MYSITFPRKIHPTSLPFPWRNPAVGPAARGPGGAGPLLPAAPGAAAAEECRSAAAGGGRYWESVDIIWDYWGIYYDYWESIVSDYWGLFLPKFIRNGRYKDILLWNGGFCTGITVHGFAILKPGGYSKFQLKYPWCVGSSLLNHRIIIFHLQSPSLGHINHIPKGPSSWTHLILNHLLWHLVIWRFPEMGVPPNQLS